jgi:hypothetical protein
MTEETVASRQRSWGLVLVVAALAAIAIGAAAFLAKQEAEEQRDDVAVVTDASLDVRASPPKAKPSKKRTGRAGKTRIASNAGAADPAGGGGAGGGVGSPTPGGPSYEAALASNNQEVSIGANTGPDLTDAQLSGPMSDGTFVNDCGAPDSMSVTVKVAIRMGRAVGVSVYTNPRDAEVAGCIDHRVRELSWPSNPKMDSFVTTY